MNTDLLFNNFDLLLDAPNSIPKLRAFILDLAVRGKLVLQDPTDEPAAVLLQKIEAEKKRLIKEGIIRKPKKLPPISPEEVPFEVPTGWKWVRLGQIRHDWGQKKPDKKFSYIDVSAINKELGVISDNYQILESQNAPSRARKIVEQGTVIYSTVRPYLLNIAVVNEPFNPEPIVSTAFAILHPFSGVFNRYLYFYLRSNPLVEYVESEMVGMAYPAISDSKFFPAPFPLPPLAEQKRIVAKVDELMALCDRLEAMQAKAEKTRIQLNTASLHSLRTAQAPDTFRHHWQRITDQFDRLYTTRETVANSAGPSWIWPYAANWCPRTPTTNRPSSCCKRSKLRKNDSSKKA